jgi:hypothetical protein
MAVNGVIAPKEYNLYSVELESYGGDIYDIKYMIQEINIYEDMFTNSLSGEVLITDSLNLIKYLPIVGQEKIRISFSTAGKDEIADRVEQTFVVYKLSDRDTTGDKVQSYMLFFTTPEAYQSSRTKISKSYSGTESTIVKDIVQNLLKSKKPLVFEPTKYDNNVVIPNWSPFSTINWLSRRSLSGNYSGANYTFFETTKGYKFVPIEHLMDSNIYNQTVQKYVYAPANVRMSNGDRDLNIDFRKVESYNIKEAVDTLKNGVMGMYASNLVTYDVTDKKYSEKSFDYFETYDNMKHVEPNLINQGQGTTALGSKVLDDEGNGLSDYTDAVRKFYPKTKHVHEESVDNHVEEWYSPRISQLQQLNNNRVVITVAGDSSRQVGDVVDFFVPSPEPSDSQKEFDRYISGRYIVVSLRHQLTVKGYYIHMELAKDAYATPLPNVSGV